MHGQYCVESFDIDRRSGIDIDEFEFFAELFDDRLLWGLLEGSHVDPTHHVGFGLEDPKFLAGRFGNGRQRSCQFVFHRDSWLEERDDDFLESTAERCTEHNRLVGDGAPFAYTHDLWGDSILLLSLFFLFARRGNRIVDANLHRHPGTLGRRFELLEQADQLVFRFCVSLRDIGRNVRIDDHIAVLTHPTDQPGRDVRERTDLQFCRIVTLIFVSEENTCAQYNRSQAHSSQNVVRELFIAVFAAAPVPFADQDHAQVETQDGQQKVIANA